jgi:hypothetical protein
MPGDCSGRQAHVAHVPSTGIEAPPPLLGSAWTSRRSWSARALRVVELGVDDHQNTAAAAIRPIAHQVARLGRGRSASRERRVDARRRSARGPAPWRATAPRGGDSGRTLSASRVASRRYGKSVARCASNWAILARARRGASTARATSWFTRSPAPRRAPRSARVAAHARHGTERLAEARRDLALCQTVEVRELENASLRRRQVGRAPSKCAASAGPVALERDRLETSAVSAVRTIIRLA